MESTCFTTAVPKFALGSGLAAFWLAHRPRAPVPAPCRRRQRPRPSRRAAGLQAPLARVWVQWLGPLAVEPRRLWAHQARAQWAALRQACPRAARQAALDHARRQRATPRALQLLAAS